MSMVENMVLKSVARTQPGFTPSHGYRESIWCSSSSCPGAVMLSWNMTYDGSEPVWVIKLELGHHLPEILSAHGVKGLCKINKGCVDVSVLFLALLIKLPCRKDHIHCSSSSTKAALTLREMFSFEVLDEAVEEDSGKNFAHYGQK